VRAGIGRGNPRCPSQRDARAHPRVLTTGGQPRAHEPQDGQRRGRVLGRAATAPSSERGRAGGRHGDGKGVPIRRGADQAPIEAHRPKKGPKRNRKKMATLRVVYTLERHRRGREEVADALFQKPKDKLDEKGKRPAPQHKRVRRASPAHLRGAPNRRSRRSLGGWRQSAVPKIPIMRSRSRV
jgi:hypothetical protein